MGCYWRNSKHFIQKLCETHMYAITRKTHRTHSTNKHLTPTTKYCMCACCVQCVRHCVYADLSPLCSQSIRNMLLMTLVFFFVCLLCTPHILCSIILLLSFRFDCRCEFYCSHWRLFVLFAEILPVLFSILVARPSYFSIIPIYYFILRLIAAPI